MDEEKRKNLEIVVLVVLVIVLGTLLYLALTDKLSLNRKNNNIDNSSNVNEVNNNEVNSSNIKINDSKDYVYDAQYYYDNKYDEITSDKETTTYTEDGFNTVIWYNGKMRFSDLNVPYININTKEAKEINKQLEELYIEYAKIFDEHASRNSGMQILSYRTFKYQDILAVFVTYGEAETDLLMPNYLVYNFDLTSGKLLNYREFLQKIGKEENVVTDTVIKQIKEQMPTMKCYTESMENMDGIAGSTIDQTIDKFKSSISNDVVYFISEYGDINYIIDVKLGCQFVWYKTLFRVLVP